MRFPFKENNNRSCFLLLKFGWKILDSQVPEKFKLYLHAKKFYLYDGRWVSLSSG